MVRETLQAIADDLKGSPITLALVLICLFFAGIMIYTLREISSAGNRRDQIITSMIEKCVIHNDQRTIQ